MKVIAGILGLSGVVLGALGAHALKDRLALPGMAEAWQTAVTYHLIHAVALYALAIERISPRPTCRWQRWTGWAWSAGTLLFSGSLYLLALGGPRWLGPVTPLGGLALTAGWICVVVAGLRSSNSDRAS